MAKKKVKLYDLDGKEQGDVEVSFLAEDDRANPQSTKDYIRALRENARQWSANTKDRSQSHHSGAKPHAQKGTGKARQGFLGAPQYKGGGRVHTPKPKFDQHVRINRKERRKAIATLLSEKIEAGRVIFVKDEIEAKYKEPKTKTMAKFMQNVDLTKSCLFLLTQREGMEVENFKKSLSNLPKVTFQYIENVNGYAVIAHQNIVVVDSAAENLNEWVSA
ncbi:MAG: 50S ribosomal protein L4 [Chlamydiia bacterium]|nr:50S ribosomal protein L4 [Chlamydiia bacterium]